jgi:hypothetical protein
VKRGILETVTAIICFTGLIAYFNQPLWLIPMVVFAVGYLGFN